MRTSAVVAEEEEEEFYESLDWILSSSCSSTSTSDDDADQHHHCRVPQLPPLVAASYHVWISEPSSVEKCRRRLLHQMGLAVDPSLSRALPAAVHGGDGGLADVGRSSRATASAPAPISPSLWPRPSSHDPDPRALSIPTLYIFSNLSGPRFRLEPRSPISHP